MRGRGFTVGRKVTALVALFVGCLGAVALVSVRAVDNQTTMANRMFAEGEQLRAANVLLDELHEAYESPALHADLVAKIDASIADVQRIAVLDEGEAPERVALLKAEWQRAVELSTGADGVASHAAIQRALPHATAVVSREMSDRIHAYHELAQSQHDERTNVLVILVLAVLLSAGASIAMLRSVVSRVRGYASFAVAVAEGSEREPLALRGRDELTELGATLNSLVARQGRERAYDETQTEFVDTLQLAEDEEEAHDLVKRHLERTVSETRVTVLNRNNSADRLEPTTHLPDDSPLRDTLVDAGPRSCLAVRFARPNDSGCGDDKLVDCSVCGSLDRPATCQPLLVGGEVIGAVLVEHAGVLDGDDRRRVRQSVAQASPVLANLRNLAVAEFRANNDSLTGVANKRAAEDTLKRLAAIASRTVTPLAAVLLDLDHFKQLNDVYGHDKGDEVLAATGHAMRSVLRESDFVGRFGGEEFLVLLPDTDRAGAATVAEILRIAVESIAIPGVDRAVTASFGVAVLPDDAGEPSALVRMADRALYAAKAAGRNRVELAQTSTAWSTESGMSKLA